MSRGMAQFVVCYSFGPLGVPWWNSSHIPFFSTADGAGCGFNGNGEIVCVTKAYVRRFGLLWDFSFVVGLGRGSGEARGGKGSLSLTV